MKQINLMYNPNLMKVPMGTKILGFIKEYGLIIGMIIIAIFVWQGLFGTSGAMNYLKQQQETINTLVETQGKMMENFNLQIENQTATIEALKGEQEAARQHIGTVTRKEYHPAMKRVKKQNAEEQVEEVRLYNSNTGLSSR